MKIWWKWSKEFDNRTKLNEKDQYYESWYDRIEKYIKIAKKILSSVDDISERDRSSDCCRRI